MDKNPDLSNRYKAFDGRVWEKFKELKQEEIFIHINISASGCISRLSNIMNKLNMDELSVQIKLK